MELQEHIKEYTETKDKKTVFELAQDCIQELKKKYPHYSSTQIASQIGMDQATFSRIENRQIKKPSLNSITKLLLGLGQTSTISQIIEMVNPDLASVIKEKEKMSHNAETPMVGSDFSKYIKIPLYRNIVMLALSRSGTTRQEIEREGGKWGLAKLEELLNMGLLTESKGIIYAMREKEQITFDQDTLKALLIGCLEDSYSPEDFGKGENWLSLQTNSVSKEGLRLIRSKIQKTFKEIAEILFSPKHQGNEKVFVGMVVDVLNKDKR